MPIPKPTLSNTRYRGAGTPWSTRIRSGLLGAVLLAPSAARVRHMGLWSWILGKGTNGETGQVARARHAPKYRRPTADEAVAVLEPPEAPATTEQVEPAEKWWAPKGAVLTEPPRVDRPSLSTEARALENLLVSHFDGHDLRLPPLLHVAETVLPQLSDSNCDLEKVTDSIAEDQVIAAALLRMANSVLYRGLNKITALRPAITRIGIRALRTLLMHESLRAATLHGKHVDNEFARMIWRRSLAGAYVMRGLSGFTDADEEDAFLIGLLHDIGNVVVLRVVHGEQIAQPYEIDDDTFEYLCYECHQEFGELIADAWSLPPSLKALISDHHTYPDPDDPLRTLRLQLQLTDMISALLSYTPFVSYNLLESRVVCDLDLAARNDFMAFLEHLPDQLAETVGEL